MTDKTVKREGPHLWGIVGRARASIAGFDYSPALKKAGGNWDYQALNKFNSDPAIVLPGTVMVFRGLQDESTRVDLIAYLRTVADSLFREIERRKFYLVQPPPMMEDSMKNVRTALLVSALGFLAFATNGKHQADREELADC